MKNKIFRLFSSNIRIKVNGKNINSFIRRLIRNKINIVKVIPISYKEIDLIINYSDLDEILKYKAIYNIRIVKYYGKLNIIRFINNNKYIFLSLILGIIIITILSNIIFSVDVIHSNNNLVKYLTEELKRLGIRKYSFIKSSDEIEKIENKILENNKDRIEWLEIIRNGTKYIVRVEERIINKINNDNKIYDIISSKNAIIKEIYAESGVKVKNINTYVKKGDIVISSDIVKPNNEVVIDSAKGRVLGEVWYNVTIDFPFHYHEELYTGNKKKVLVLNFINKRIPFFDFNEYKTFDKDIKYIFSDNIFPINLSIEYQYETNVLNINYSYESAKENAIKNIKKKLIEKYKGIEDISQVKINNEYKSEKGISLNLFVSTIENITEYCEKVY